MDRHEVSAYAIIVLLERSKSLVDEGVVIIFQERISKCGGMWALPLHMNDGRQHLGYTEPQGVKLMEVAHLVDLFSEDAGLLSGRPGFDAMSDAMMLAIAYLDSNIADKGPRLPDILFFVDEDGRPGAIDVPDLGIAEDKGREQSIMRQMLTHYHASAYACVQAGDGVLTDLSILADAIQGGYLIRRPTDGPEETRPAFIKLFKIFAQDSRTKTGGLWTLCIRRQYEGEQGYWLEPPMAFPAVPKDTEVYLFGYPATTVPIAKTSKNKRAESRIPFRGDYGFLTPDLLMDGYQEFLKAIGQINSSAHATIYKLYEIKALFECIIQANYHARAQVAELQGVPEPVLFYATEENSDGGTLKTVYPFQSEGIPSQVSEQRTKLQAILATSGAIAYALAMPAYGLTVERKTIAGPIRELGIVHCGARNEEDKFQKAEAVVITFQDRSRVLNGAMAALLRRSGAPASEELIKDFVSAWFVEPGLADLFGRPEDEAPDKKRAPHRRSR